MDNDEDFGFHDFEGSCEHFSALVLSDYKILPRAGGWDDQLSTDTDDLLIHLRGLAWARSLKDESKNKSDSDDGVSDGSDGLHNAGNWEGLFK